MDAPSSEAVNHELWARTGMFGLGCRACLEQPGSALRMQTPHTEHPSKGPGGESGAAGMCWGQVRAEQRGHSLCLPRAHTESTQRAGSDHSSQNQAQPGQSCVSDSRYKNSVYCIHKFTPLFLWMTSVCTTHGRHPRWSSFFGICLQFCEKTYKVSTSKSNLSIIMRNKYILYYFIVGSWTLTNFNIYK